MHTRDLHRVTKRVRKAFISCNSLLYLQTVIQWPNPWCNNSKLLSFWFGWEGRGTNNKLLCYNNVSGYFGTNIFLFFQQLLFYYVIKYVQYNIETFIWTPSFLWLTLSIENFYYSLIYLGTVVFRKKPFYKIQRRGNSEVVNGKSVTYITCKLYI